MGKNSLFSLEFFPSLNNTEEFFQKITADENVGKRILNQHVLMSFLAFIYGVIMGSYHSFAQAIMAGFKVSVLFTLALLICFPAFFIIQYILGSRLKIYQMVSVILSGFVLMTAIMVSFTPIVIIFLLTGSNYYFLQLLHILIFILPPVAAYSNFHSLRSIRDENHRRRPQIFMRKEKRLSANRSCHLSLLGDYPGLYRNPAGLEFPALSG
jgi:hypothetical protein